MSYRSVGDLAADFDGFVFDLDGVVVDTEPLKFEAYRQAFGSRGIDLPSGVSGWKGLREEQVVRFWMHRLKAIGDVDSIIKDKRRAFRNYLVQGAPLIPDFTRFYLELAAREKPAALSTSSNRRDVDTILAALALQPPFVAVIDGDAVTKKKPAPETYIRAAVALGLEPRRCVALEDTPVGIEAARGAGLFCIALTTSYLETELRQADQIIGGFGELLP